MPTLIVLMLLTWTGQPGGVGPSPESPVRPAIEPFGYRGVRLDDGPLRRQVDAAREDYLRIPNDDLLRGFRLRAGRPAPGADLGGWYSSDTFHVFGQILSGLARLHAATGEPACREKAEALLAGWADCIEPDGYFYYSRKPNAPHYIYDKMVGGLTDMVLYCDSKLAAGSLARITGWAMKNLDRSNPYAFGGTEWYTLSENLYRAHRATGDPRYREFAAVWHYPEYWDIYARKGDLFGDRGNGRRTAVYHAYSHVNTLGGAAQAYLHTGERRYLDTILHAHAMLVAQQCDPTGGFGPDEQLLPRAEWIKKADYSHNSFETQCGCFAVFKLCKYLLTITGRADYGDWIEHLAYNGIAATIPMSPDGRVFYYSDYNALGGVKHNHPVGWSCCTGTRPMALADLHDLVYFRGADDLYVNLYVPSTVTWDRPGGGGPVVIRQLTRFPESDSSTLVVGLPSRDASRFGLRLRVPSWLAGPIEVAVNGEPVAGRIDSHSWAILHREWRDGDRVTVRLPLRFAVRPLDDAAPVPAMILRGPVALAVRATGENSHPGDLLREPDLERTLVAADGVPLTYRPRSGAELLVRPFYMLKQDEPYALYLDPNRHSHREARFAGDWQSSGAFRFDDHPGDSAAFSFRGTGIRWIGYRFDDAGTAEVRIDDRPVVRVDQYAPRRDEPFEWRSDGLPPGEHRITLTISESKPAASKGRFINIAGFEVKP